MKNTPIIFTALFQLLFTAGQALQTGACAEEYANSFVYLGAQSGGKIAPTMVFADNFTFSRSNAASGHRTKAWTLWVTNPNDDNNLKLPAYGLKHDIYYCDQKKLSHQRLIFFNRNGSLLTDQAENPGVRDAPAGQTLAALVFRKVCGRNLSAVGTLAVGAQNRLQTARLTAAVILVLAAPKTGKYAYPRPALPLQVGYYLAGMASTENILVPAGGAYRIPAKNATITDIYRAADGHPVLYYYSRTGGGKSDYYDSKTGRDLFPGQAYAMAHSPGNWLAEKLKPPGLLKLEPEMVTFTVPYGKSLEEVEYRGEECLTPSNTSIEAGIDGSPASRLVFFRRARKTDIWKRGCAPNLTGRYAATYMKLIAADHAGFFAQADDQPFLVWFDWKGHSPFFANQDDLIAVPFEDLDAALNPVPTGKTVAMDYNVAIRRADALIARYAKLQRKGISPLAR